MSDFVKRIRTQKGDKQIDYTALANLPVSDTTLSESGAFADSKAVGVALDKKVNLPTTADGTVINGTTGQILVNNGDGTTSWVNIPKLETDANGNPVWSGSSIDSDDTLTVRGAAADAAAVGEALGKKINLPVTDEGVVDIGIVGQMLVNNGDGTTGWITVPKLESDGEGNPIWVNALPTVNNDGVLVFK